MNAVEVLQQARGLIAKGWVQGVSAVDAEGNPVHSSKGCAFCAVGALLAVPCDFGPSLEAEDRLKRVLPKPFTSLVGFNDTKGRTQDEVLALFDLAINGGVQ